MAPMLNTLISRIVFGQMKKSRPDLPRPASITFSEGDFPGGHHGGYPSQPLSVSNSPARGPPEAAPLFGNSARQGSSIQSSTLSNSLIDNQVQPDSVPLETHSAQMPAGHGKAVPATEPKQQGSPDGRHEPGQDTSSGPSQTPSRQNHSTSGGPDPAPSTSTSGADYASISHGQHGYNGFRDGSDAAAAIRDTATSGSIDGKASVSQTDAIGTDSSTASPASNAGQTHATERSTRDQDSFVELVQGTEQLLGMLGARDVS